MAHELSERYNTKVELVSVKDRYSRNDRICELDSLLVGCVHNITIVESKSFGLLFRIIDKLNTIIFLRKLNFKDLIGLESYTLPSQLPDFRKKPPKFVRGYFQSAALVEKHSSTLFVELSRVLEEVSNPMRAISSEDYQVAHFRRGDTRDIAASWGILSVQYYKEHILENLLLCICTDEEGFMPTLSVNFPNAVIIGPKESSTWVAIKTMTESKVLVIANSTLSWWAAWYLSKLSGHTVIFPFPWRPQDILQSRSLEIKGVTSATAIFEK
jgi:hypothetical protein